jgi:hypothetical protein
MWTFRPATLSNNLRDLGFDFTVVVETDEDCGADLDLLTHLSLGGVLQVPSSPLGASLV